MLSKSRNKDEGDKGVVRLDGQEIPNSECFQYLVSTIRKDWEIEEDVNPRIRVGGEVEKHIRSIVWL